MIILIDYFPCTTPLNMTITLDDRGEIPLHPLDLSAQPSGGSQCMALFQQSSVLEDPNGFGDIILGVPFLRNVYTVMAYEPVSSSGIVGSRKRVDSNPQLGLLNITNATLAMEEFNTVRVENKPLDGNQATTSTSSSGLSTGATVGIVIGGIFALAAVLLGARFFYTTRREKRRKKVDAYGDEDTKKEAYAMAYSLRPLRSHSYVPSEDTQQTLSDPFARLNKKYDTAHSKLASLSEDEFGFRRKSKASGTNSDGGSDAENRPDGGDGGGGEQEERVMSWIDAYPEYQPPLMGEWRPPTMHERSFSASSTASAHALLDRPPSRSRPSDPGPGGTDEFGGLPTLRSLSAANGSTRRSGSAGRAEDLTLPNDRDQVRNHARGISNTTSGSSSSGEGDETTPMTAPPASVTRPPPRGALQRPVRTLTGPRPLSQMSRVLSANNVESPSSMYSQSR